MLLKIENAIFLELHERDYKEKKYHNLIVYEAGQKSFPQVRSLNVHHDVLTEAAKLKPGSQYNILARVYLKKGNVAQLSFVGLAA